MNASAHILRQEIERCARCPRLVEYRQVVATTKRKSFAHCTYWGRPVPGLGPFNAVIWIVGLAPAAHGANRTGRIFTGDRSGDFLFAALHRMGLANQPTSLSIDDGLKLKGVYISAAVRCAPPDNKPLPSEAANCSEYLDREWRLLRHKRVILALGGFAWNNVFAMAARCGVKVQSPRPKFGHGAICDLAKGLKLVGSYHVSQQNTFTGRLTPVMFDEVLGECLRSV